MTDNKGFIRFETDEFFAPRVKKLEKMLGFNATLPNWYPSENNPAYEKYPYKKFKGIYTEPYIACPAEVFCYRYFKLWTKEVLKAPWLRFSYVESHSGDRKCITMCVFRIQWKNGPYHQILEISGINLDGNQEKLDIRFDSLELLCVHVCTKDESNRLSDMLNETMPEPHIPVFKVDKEYYSKHYDIYLEDCKAANLTPLPKEMIERATQDFYLSIPSGCITGICDDYYVVNSFPTEGK